VILAVSCGEKLMGDISDFPGLKENARVHYVGL